MPLPPLSRWPATLFCAVCRSVPPFANRLKNQFAIIFKTKTAIDDIYRPYNRTINQCREKKKKENKRKICKWTKATDGNDKGEKILRVLYRIRNEKFMDKATLTCEQKVVEQLIASPSEIQQPQQQENEWIHTVLSDRHTLQMALAPHRPSVFVFSFFLVNVSWQRICKLKCQNTVINWISWICWCSCCCCCWYTSDSVVDDQWHYNFKTSCNGLISVLITHYSLDWKSSQLNFA